MRLSLRIASTKNSPVLQMANLRLSVRLLQQDGKPHRMEGPSSKRHGLKKCKGREVSQRSGAAVVFSFLKGVRR